MRAMNVLIALVLLLLGTSAGAADGVFTPPAKSAGAVEGVDFRGAVVGPQFRSRFMECDTKNACDGKPMGHGCRDDANRNSVLLHLKGATLFFDAKMGPDMDGSPYSAARHGTDQPETSLRYPLQNRPSINADRVPFIVIPQGGFGEALGVEVGDVAAVVYGNQRIYAVVADKGPQCKLGEGSLQLHERFGHAVCKQRDAGGNCTDIRDISIEKNVLYFIFPGTRAALYPGLTPENINSRIESIGAAAWSGLATP